MPKNSRGQTINRFGQFVSEKPIAIAVSKRLRAIAEDVAVKVRPLVRDELEYTLRSKIYASRTPATQAGKEVQEYNETKAHQKRKLYHHTGTLERSIYCIIEGNTVKAMIRDEKYGNGRSATQVYDDLKFGTTNNPKKPMYKIYDDGGNIIGLSPYIQQKPHNFEARTREYMKTYLNNLEKDIYENGAKNINPKYLRKLSKADLNTGKGGK